MRDLNNMTVMITGASAGFGMVTAKMLVSKVLMLFWEQEGLTDCKL